MPEGLGGEADVRVVVVLPRAQAFNVRYKLLPTTTAKAIAAQESSHDRPRDAPGVDGAVPAGVVSASAAERRTLPRAAEQSPRRPA